MDKFDNISEQRFWNSETSFTEDGDEWSTKFGSTEALYEALLKAPIETYCKGHGLEIAPGWGRITSFLLPHCETLCLVDLNENCVAKCVSKFGNKIKAYYVNDGKSLHAIPDESLDFVFSYDSFVHIHFNVFTDYITEFARVLKPGSFGVIHHSWYGGGEDYSFNNFGGRANCDLDELKGVLEKNGFSIISQNPCNVSVWYEDLTDLITVFQKK